MSDTGAVERIARRYQQGLIRYDWALYLVAREIGSTDRWTPIVVLSDAVLTLSGSRR